MKLNPVISLLLLFFALLPLSCADVKQAGRDIGHGTRDLTRAIGHGTRGAVKAIGHGTRKLVKDVGKEINKASDSSTTSSTNTNGAKK